MDQSFNLFCIIKQFAVVKMEFVPKKFKGFCKFIHCYRLKENESKIQTPVERVRENSAREFNIERFEGKETAKTVEITV